MFYGQMVPARPSVVQYAHQIPRAGGRTGIVLLEFRRSYSDRWRNLRIIERWQSWGEGRDGLFRQTSGKLHHSQNKTARQSTTLMMSQANDINLMIKCHINAQPVR
jgi:hypothetical protein